MTLTDLCEKLRNWFDVDRHFGTFEIENGTIDLDFIREGQFYRLVGSKQDGIYFVENYKKLMFVKSISDGTQSDFNIDGIEAKDETFNGAIWELSFPLNFVLFYENVCDWETKYADKVNSPFQSESFGGYSYSKANGSNGGLTVWDKFASDLLRWQKI